MGAAQSKISNPEVELFNAIAECNLFMVSHVLNCGANINALDKHGGMTPLVCAIMNTSTDSIIRRLLVHTDLDINVVDKHGHNALYYAVEQAFRTPYMRGRINLLINAGSNLNHCDNKGQTIMLNLIDKNYFENHEYVQLLLTKGTDFHVRDQSGRTAYDYAQQNNRQDIIILLNKYYLKMVHNIGGYMTIICTDIRKYIEKFSFFMTTKADNKSRQQKPTTKNERNIVIK